MQLDKLADLVVLTIKTTLAPVLERVAAAEARLSVLGDLRDRVVTVETKAALLPAVPPSVDFDAAPLLARIAALEAGARTTANVVCDIGTQIKSAADAADHARVIALETKAVIPAPAPVRADGPTATDVELAIMKALTPMIERLTVVETRASLPGPPGLAGKDGQPGTDGADGMGFDDVAVDFDGDRTLAVKFIKGDRVKAFPFSLPYQRQQGVYIDGKSYTQGDVVTWGGSQWHCNDDTVTKPGDGSKAWTLIVKRGRDGKDGRDATAAHPVVKVGA